VEGVPLKPFLIPVIPLKAFSVVPLPVVLTGLTACSVVALPEVVRVPPLGNEGLVVEVYALPIPGPFTRGSFSFATLAAGETFIICPLKYIPLAVGILLVYDYKPFLSFCQGKKKDGNI
jgi:hypothetical protein